MINFPLYGTLGDVFARGRPTAELGYRIRDMTALHARPQLMPTFVDDHDVDRFLAGGSDAGLRQALLAIMTLPGIPTLYYGTEQGFTAQRAAMFKGGIGAGGRDHFDTSAPLYRFLQRAIALRRDHRVFSRGTPTIVRDNAASPGVLAYRIRHGDDDALVVFNSADHPSLLDALDLQLPGGTRLRGLFALDGTPADLVVDAHGAVTLPLAARSGNVWRITRERAAIPPTPATVALAPLSKAAFAADFEVHGSARGVRELQLVVDGDIASAQRVQVDRAGRWHATIGIGGMNDPSIEHRVVAWADSTGATSPARAFRATPAWRVLADVADRIRPVPCAPALSP